MIVKPSLLLATLCLSVGAVSAQPRTLHALLWNETTSTTRLATQLTTCGPTSPSCNSPLPLYEDWAGGLALAPSRDSIWYSNGSHLIEKIRYPNCMNGCTSPAVRSLGPTSLVGGLAMSAPRNELYAVESIGGRAAITTYMLTSPCPTPVGTTEIALPTALHHSGALAFDGANDKLFVAASWFGGPVPANVVYVLKRGRSGGWLLECTMFLDACGTDPVGPVLGMAYDECRTTLWIAERNAIHEQSLTYRTGCPTLTSLGCCQHRSSEHYHGIDVDVGLVKEVGSSCTTRGCGACSSMKLVARGRPVVGNYQFQYQIQDGPVGASAFLILAGGACSSTPFSCGTIYPSLLARWVAVPMGTLVGTGGCDGSALLTTPVPGVYGLCGATVCAQGIVLCPNGLGLTNGLLVEYEG